MPTLEAVGTRPQVHTEVKVTNNAPEWEMQLLRKLQNDFYTRLNLPNNPQDLLHRSFNPVTDRWHVEVLRMQGDTQGLVSFQEEMRENHRTDLMERYHAAESYGKFLIKGKDLYSAEFSDVPLGEILRRGAEYRKGLGSTEQEREGELGEIAGWDVMNDALTNPDTPVGTTYISLSPPSKVKDGVYKGKFVDTNRVATNGRGERYVERTRIAVDWDEEQYKKAALSLDPNYFKDYDGRPMDAWFLSHPLKQDKQVVPVSGAGLSKDDFNKIYEDPVVQRLIGHYEQLIHAREVDWLEVSLAVNSIRNHADKLKDNLTSGIQVPDTINADVDFIKFQAYVYKLGMQQVKTVGGGGCPPNKGIDMNGLLGSSGVNVGIDLLSNSIAKFGIESILEESEGCKCQDKSDNHYHCPKESGGCGKKYADETKRSPEDRTKKCQCGFKFGC